MSQAQRGKRRRAGVARKAKAHSEQRTTMSSAPAGHAFMTGKAPGSPHAPGMAPLRAELLCRRRLASFANAPAGEPQLAGSVPALCWEGRAGESSERGSAESAATGLDITCRTATALTRQFVVVQPQAAQLGEGAGAAPHGGQRPVDAVVLEGPVWLAGAGRVNGKVRERMPAQATAHASGVSKWMRDDISASEHSHVCQVGEGPLGAPLVGQGSAQLLALDENLLERAAGRMKSRGGREGSQDTHVGEAGRRWEASRDAGRGAECTAQRV